MAAIQSLYNQGLIKLIDKYSDINNSMFNLKEALYLKQTFELYDYEDYLGIAHAIMAIELELTN